VQLVPTYKNTRASVTIDRDLYEKLHLLRQDGESLGDFVKESVYFNLEHNPRTVRPRKIPEPEEIQLISDTIDTERFFDIYNSSDPDPESLVTIPAKWKTREKLNKLRMPGETYQNLMERIVDYYTDHVPQVIMMKSPPPEVRFNPNLRYLRMAVHESLESTLRPYESPRVIQHTQRVMMNIRGTPMYQVWYNGFAYTLAKKMTVAAMVDLLNKNLIENK
jgi:hypothetical protein